MRDEYTNVKTRNLIFSSIFLFNPRPPADHMESLINNSEDNQCFQGRINCRIEIKFAILQLVLSLIGLQKGPQGIRYEEKSTRFEFNDLTCTQSIKRLYSLIQLFRLFLYKVKTKKKH